VASGGQASVAVGGPASADVPWVILVCPYCLHVLERTDSGAVCRACDCEYGLTPAGQLDLRPHRPKHVDVAFELTTPPTDLPPASLRAADQPAVDFSGFPLPPTISARFASHLPRARHPGALALDLGCGDCRARGVLEHAGFNYVGVDIEHPEAPLLADAHALPFADESFDLVLSIGVVEYFRYPHVAIDEVFRVLEPGGTFIGNVAFLVPFLPGTHYHHTPLGIASTLRHGGLEVERLLVDKRWTVLEAAGSIGLFPRFPMGLVRLLVAPVKLLHLAWWRLGARFAGRPLSEVERLLRISGDVEYVARKPLSGESPPRA
jgi:SAM-dependent methyltransferase